MVLLFFDWIYYYGVPSSSGFNFWTFFNTAIGSFLAFGSALVIFRKTTNRDRKKEMEERNRKHREKVLYLASLIIDVPSIIRKQAGNYKTFSAETLKDLYKIHTPRFVIKTNLTRLTDKINQEDFFHAYVNQFDDPERRLKEISNFKNIYEILDYYEGLLNQSIDSVREMKSRIREAMESYKSALGDAEVYLVGLLNVKNLQQHASPFLNSLNQLIINYVQGKQSNQTNLRFHYANFLTPAIDLISKFGSYQFIEVHEAVIKLRNGRVRFNSIELLSKQQAEEFEDYQNELLKPLAEFEEKIGAMKNFVASVKS